MTPHIPNIESARSKLNPSAYHNAMVPEDLAFQMTKLIEEYMDDSGDVSTGRAIMEVCGAVDVAMLEFQRSIVNPWLEDEADRNGSVMNAYD